MHNNELILNKFNQEIIVSAVKQGNIDDFSHQKTLRSHACALRFLFLGFFFSVFFICLFFVVCFYNSLYHYFFFQRIYCTYHVLAAMFSWRLHPFTQTSAIFCSEHSNTFVKNQLCLGKNLCIWSSVGLSKLWKTLKSSWLTLNLDTIIDSIATCHFILT